MIGWVRGLRARLAPTAPIEESDWIALLAGSALFAGADEGTQRRLRELAARFLGGKTFSAAGGHALEPAQCLAIAALACLPVLHLGYDALAGWRDVIVYPGEFRVKREHHDEDSGVVTTGDDDLIGEAWEHGPLVLSWADVATDLAHPFDGFNVVVHEIAHKLDMRDGAMNGVPLLPPSIGRREWVAIMQPAYDAFVRAVERGRDRLVDPYAAQSVDEFFAVTSELHFSDPRTLRSAMPGVAALLARYYGPAAVAVETSAR
jgi:Mlc titration factor MtfA (ptsG expression regulator)